MKTKIVSMRLKPVIIAKIERIFGMNLKQFILVVLDLAENNQYIKNKIKQRAEND